MAGPRHLPATGARRRRSRGVPVPRTPDGHQPRPRPRGGSPITHHKPMSRAYAFVATMGLLLVGCPHPGGVGGPTPAGSVSLPPTQLPSAASLAADLTAGV